LLLDGSTIGNSSSNADWAGATYQTLLDKIAAIKADIPKP